MNNYNWNFKTKNIKKSSNQYEIDELMHNEIVDATYIEYDKYGDNNNPFIAALPPYDSENQNYFIRNYNKSILGYDYDKVKSMSNSEKVYQLSKLHTNFRVLLPFQKQLEDEFYMSLVTSYNSRKMYHDRNINIPIVVNNNEQQIHQKSWAETWNSTNSSFSLIGYSGCGKSTSVSQMLEHYPQVIRHINGEGEFVPQIVYLVVSCIPNSNFNELYVSIGKAIDRALGNIDEVYEKIIAKERGLSGKMKKVIKLIETLNIGCIIFDEIQLIDFKHTKENSFEGLMTIANETKVAIAVVGTEDAKKKMFLNLRNARRVGTLIDASTYTKNKAYFKNIVCNMMQYQWFDEKVEITDDLIEALFKNTHGIISQLINLYAMIHIYYFKFKNKKPKVDANLVEIVNKKYFPLINELSGKLQENELNEIISKSTSETLKILSDAISTSQKEANKLSENIEQHQNQILNEKEIENKLYKALIKMGYEEELIDIAFKRALNDGDFTTEAELSQNVIENLTKLMKRKIKKAASKPSITQMQTALNL